MSRAKPKGLVPYQIAVVVGLPPAGHGCADTMLRGDRDGVLNEERAERTNVHDRDAYAVRARVLVWTLGEVVILDTTDSPRELDGRGRKPGKWGVRLRHCDTLGEALIVAMRVRRKNKFNASRL